MLLVTVMSADPARLSWALLIVYALAQVGCAVFRIDAVDVLLWNIAFFPYLIGPAILAHFLVLKSPLAWQKWTFVIAVVAIVSTMAWLIMSMLRNPDAQDGIALLFFPALQLMGLLLVALIALIGPKLWRGLRGPAGSH